MDHGHSHSHGAPALSHGHVDQGMDTLDIANSFSVESPMLSSRPRRNPVSSGFDSHNDSHGHSHSEQHGHSHSHGSSSYIEPTYSQSNSENFFLDVISKIGKDSEKQPLLVYLSLRLIYTLVALIASSYSNSVGLVCIAFYSLFECVGLAVELWASGAERERSYQSLGSFSYGYQRLEVLSAFGNTVFLMFVSLFTLEHAIERFFEAPTVSSSMVISIALIGCILNLIGLLITQSATKNETKKALQGQVLWVRLVTDNLVSFGVTFSAFCVQYGYHEADPIVAGLISIAVIYTSIPLAKETKDILLLATPDTLSRDLYKCLGEVLSIEGVLECSQEHFWTNCNGTMVGSMQLMISDQGNEQAILARVNSLFRPFIQNLTVQIQSHDWEVRSNQLRGIEISP